MPELTLTDEIEMLRVQLETSVSMPAVFVVSSARPGDGKELVASGLAGSMHTAGYSTLLVLADEETRNIDPALEPKSLNEVAEFGIAPYLVRHSSTGLRVMLVPSTKIRHTVSRDAVVSFVDTCRSTYDVTIVESASVLMNSFAMLVSAAANGVLLTVREGRRVCREDRQLAKALEREQASFLGVVSIAKSIIRDTPASPVRNGVVRAKVPTVTGGIASTREKQTV